MALHPSQARSLAGTGIPRRDRPPRRRGSFMRQEGWSLAGTGRLAGGAPSCARKAAWVSRVLRFLRFWVLSLRLNYILLFKLVFQVETQILVVKGRFWAPKLIKFFQVFSSFGIQVCQIPTANLINLKKIVFKLEITQNRTKRCFPSGTCVFGAPKLIKFAPNWIQVVKI